jgi:hypothetical protein
VVSWIVVVAPEALFHVEHRPSTEQPEPKLNLRAVGTQEPLRLERRNVEPSNLRNPKNP